MNASKKSWRRRILAVVAIVSLATVAALVFRSHHSTQTAPAVSQSAGASHSETPHSASATPAKTAPGSIAATASTTPQPLPLASALLPPAANTFAATAAKNPAATTTAPAGGDIATLSPRERAILEKIPDARFRADVLQLDPEARFRVFKTLAANPPPDADYASLHLTTKGMLYYVCQLHPGDSGAPAPGAISAPSSDSPAAARVPISQPPVRHSRPGSRNILFLDFGGMDISNTAWNEIEDYGKVATYHAVAYSTDEDFTTFNDEEQQNIIEIWERVAEDYSPFDVDVTTEKPAAFTRTTGRALITRSTDRDSLPMPAADNRDVIGVAFTSVFAEYDYATENSPAFIYHDRSPTDNAGIAYVVSHELGHNFGLSHQGTPNTAKNGDFGYYSGHGIGATSWAPIMGNGFTRKIIQWSQGEYHDANNHEDAIAIIAGKLGYRDELAATTLADAPAITPLADGRLGATGIIRNASFSHYYAINLVASGSITIALNPALLTRGNVIVGCTDLKLEILDSSGNTRASNAPANLTYATLATTLTSGSWRLRVTSEGTGNPLASSPTGYTAYGSIGQYTLATNLVYTNPPLAAALNSNLAWTTTPGDTAAGWFGQATTTHDGVAAAQSGPIAPGQATTLFTTVEGSGTVRFWWKIAASTSDYLVFATTDSSGSTTVRDFTYGNLDWESRAITIDTTGTHQFGWTFYNVPDPDAPLPTHTGSAWVDQVTWIPTDFTFTTTPDSNEAPPDAGQFAIAVKTTKTWKAATNADWLTLATSTGIGNATLTARYKANSASTPRRATVSITSGGINRTCEIAQAGFVPLATALNNTLSWTTGGDANWTTQTIVTHDGQHAARSGIILGTLVPKGPTGQQTWLKTTVQGPGTINFWWKVSSEKEASDNTGTWGDLLYFHADGVERARTSGEKDWTQRALLISGTGAHELKWTYQKDPYLAVGADAAWLDQVTWTSGGVPTLNLSPETKQVPATKGTFTLTVSPNTAWTATSNASWLTIAPASGNDSATLTATYATNTATTTRTARITVTSGSTMATCTVTQDAATSGSTGGSGTGSGGGGGGAPSLWSLLALTLLLGLRTAKRKR